MQVSREHFLFFFYFNALVYKEGGLSPRDIEASGEEHYTDYHAFRWLQFLHINRDVGDVVRGNTVSDGGQTNDRERARQNEVAIFLFYFLLLLLLSELFLLYMKATLPMMFSRE